jgi:hypothetical protein
MIQSKPVSSRMFWAATHVEAISLKITTAPAAERWRGPLVTGYEGPAPAWLSDASSAALGSGP